MLILDFDWLNHNDWSKWFAISSLLPFCSPGFDFLGGVDKKKGQKKTKLGCEKYVLARVTILDISPG
jgi:hypothetical protein